MLKSPSLVLLVTLAAQPLRAQELPRTLADGTAVGVSGGAFLLEGEAIYTLALNLSGLRAGSVSTDFTFSLSPQFLSHGALVFATDLAAAYNLALPGVTILWKAGPTMIAGGGWGGAAAFVGVHGGLGLMVRADRRAAFRIDLLQRAYMVASRPYAVPSVSFGIVALPRAP